MAQRRLELPYDVFDLEAQEVVFVRFAEEGRHGLRLDAPGRQGVEGRLPGAGDPVFPVRDCRAMGREELPDNDTKT